MEMKMLWSFNGRLPSVNPTDPVVLRFGRMGSDITLNYRGFGKIENREFQTTGLTRTIPFAMDKVAIKKREDP
jgi:hypothetical protein